MIGEIGSYAKIIEILLDLDKLKLHLKNTGHSNFDRYIKSYEFCLAFCIDRIFDILIHDPETLDLSEDFLISRAYQNQIKRDKYPRKSELGILLSNIHGLCRNILKSKNERKLEKILPNLEENLVKPINSIIFNDFEVENDYNNYSKSELFDRITKFWLYLYFNDAKKIKIAYNHIFRKSKFSFPQIGINLRYKLNEQLFFEGYKKIVDYIWRSLLGERYNTYTFFPQILECKTWDEFDSYFGIIKEKLIFSSEENVIQSSEKVFRKKNKISNERFKYLTKNELYPRVELKPEEKLNEIFYWYPVKIIDSEFSISNATGFIILLLGLAKSQRPMKILKFKHRYQNENVYSFAILIESFSNLADYSQWYLFLEFCGDGSGLAGAAYKEIMDYITEHRAKIEINEFEVLSNSLDKYATDSLIKEYTEVIRTLKEYKSVSKGRMFEVFIAYLFNALGYHAKWSFKKDFTNKKEIDVLAYKEYENYLEFIVIEVSTKDLDISSEIMDKVKILEKNKKDLLKYLKLNEGKKCKFCGKLATIREPKTKLEESIEVLDEIKLEKLSRTVDIDFTKIKKLIVDETQLLIKELLKYLI